MITKKDISKGAISNTHISKSAEIDPSKLKGDKVGSILIADKDGKYVPRKIRGDATLLPNGEFKVASTADAGEVTEQEVRNAGGIIGKDITTGSTLVGESDGTPRSVHVGTGANAIPQRDSSGNLKAETADNADKLGNQEGAYYASTSNHTAGSSAAISTSNGGIAGTSQTIPLTMITASSTGGSSNTTDYIVEHGLGNVPLDVKVFEGDEEVETEVVSTTTTSTIKFSKPDVTFTTKIFGLKS